MKGRITLEQFVALTATNHARIYGLYPRKGSIGIGADADIAIWDPNISYTLTHDLIQDGSDYTPYEGFELTGRPILTMSRGKVIMRDGELVGDKGHGVYLPRARSPYASTVR